MQVGTFDNVFRRSTFESRLDALKALGGQAIQLHLDTVGLEVFPLEVPAGVADRVRGATTARGITVTAVSGMFNMAHPDPGVRADGLGRLASLCAACARLGTRVIGVCTGSRNLASMWRPHPDNRSAEAWRDFRDTMAAALPHAERHGVTLAMEPEVNNVVDSGESARRIIDEMRSPNLGVCLDGANIFHAGQLPRMAAVLDDLFARVGDRIAFAHGKDLDRDGDAGHLAAGHGLLDWDRYLRHLDRVGYRGAVILHGLTEWQAPGCIRFVQGKLPSS